VGQTDLPRSHEDRRHSCGALGHRLAGRGSELSRDRWRHDHQCQTRTHRAFGIILVRPRIAEIDENAVAHIFRDEAVEPGDG
jgi:hypothetical protein